MAQLNWLYVNDGGRRYNVGLFHGPRTGHFMVYCNTKVMLIDFNVLQPKSYSFFIEDELCEIKVERTDGQFSYRFDINKKANTPRNRQRQKRDRLHLWQSLASFGVLLLAVGGFYFWWQSSQGPPSAEEVTAILAQTGQEAIARVTEVDGEGILHYTFIANSRSYKGEIDILPRSPLPIEPGDEFTVRYALYAPKVHRVDFSRPTDQQIERYRDRTLAVHQGLHPELREDQAGCQVGLAFEIKGLEGLADLFFQQAPPAENPDHNQTTYQRLVRDVPFRRGNQEKCW